MDINEDKIAVCLCCGRDDTEFTIPFSSVTLGDDGRYMLIFICDHCLDRSIDVVLSANPEGMAKLIESLDVIDKNA
jgi:hypothetical protein